MARSPYHAARETPGSLRELVAGLPQSPPCRVLAVDDNRDTVETLQMLLDAFGHDTRVAYDGATAIEVARAFRPDVVLLDLAMPAMNGFEVAAQIFELLGSGNVTIIALTGYGQEADARRTRDAGFSDHLVKPVEPAALAAVLANRCPTPPGSEPRSEG